MNMFVYDYEFACMRVYAYYFVYASTSWCEECKKISLEDVLCWKTQMYLLEVESKQQWVETRRYVILFRSALSVELINNQLYPKTMSDVVHNINIENEQ